MMQSRTPICTAIVVAAGPLLAGCSPELASVEFSTITTPPIAASLAAAEIRLAEGTAIAVDVVGCERLAHATGGVESVQCRRRAGAGRGAVIGTGVVSSASAEHRRETGS